MQYFNPPKEKVYKCSCGFQTTIKEKFDYHLIIQKKGGLLDHD